MLKWGIKFVDWVWGQGVGSVLTDFYAKKQWGVAILAIEKP